MKKLPPHDQWGPNCWIVDTWLASLGYNSAWPVGFYPKKGMLKPLYQEMDTLAQA